MPRLPLEPMENNLVFLPLLAIDGALIVSRLGQPAFPTPSLGERLINDSGASPRGRERVFDARAVIASAAKQSILSLCGKMDCFASLAMTAGAMECFAEPVIGRAFVRPVGGR